MTNGQRKVVFIVGLLLAPVLLLWGIDDRSPIVGLGGALLSAGLGIFVWVGRTKEKPSSGG